MDDYTSVESYYYIWTTIRSVRINKMEWIYLKRPKQKNMEIMLIPDMTVNVVSKFSSILFYLKILKVLL